jgi:hypothetical protein
MGFMLKYVAGVEKAGITIFPSFAWYGKGPGGERSSGMATDDERVQSFRYVGAGVERTPLCDS